MFVLFYRNPNPPKDSKNPNELMTLNLGYLGQMTNLTELRLKTPFGLKLSVLPSFEKLSNLKTLVRYIEYLSYSKII